MNPTTQLLKAWITLRARACRQGVQAYRSDPLDGPAVFFTIHHGVARVYPDMAALQSRVEDLEALAVSVDAA